MCSILSSRRCMHCSATAQSPCILCVKWHTLSFSHTHDIYKYTYILYIHIHIYMCVLCVCMWLCVCVYTSADSTLHRIKCNVVRGNRDVANWQSEESPSSKSLFIIIIITATTYYDYYDYCDCDYFIIVNNRAKIQRTFWEYIYTTAEVRATPGRKKKSQCPSVCKVPIDYYSDFPFFLWRVFFPLWMCTTGLASITKAKST